ncbi:hypothetical protein KI387_002603, partial [Taxus chinensis]
MEEEEGPVTSVSWACDGRHIAVGLNNCDVQIWDTESNRQLRTLKGHTGRVGSLAWNVDSTLTSGGLDGKVLKHDVRIPEHIVETYRGHGQEVCGLKWSGSGQQLASGANDNLLHIWDNRRTEYLHRFDAHHAAVNALAWSPFQSNLLVSGGGTTDRCIKMWNTHTGACLNSIDTGSQVCALLWSKHQRELLSSHGYAHNQLTLWKYPSMPKIADLSAHTSRVLYLSQSPDGYTVASAAGDETLRLWQVFGSADAPKTISTSKDIAFKHHTHIGLGDVSCNSWHFLAEHKCLKLRFMFQSSDGYTVASAAGDETLRFWQVFGSADAPKTTSTSKDIAFKHHTHIGLRTLNAGSHDRLMFDMIFRPIVEDQEKNLIKKSVEDHMVENIPEEQQSGDTCAAATPTRSGSANFTNERISNIGNGVEKEKAPMCQRLKERVKMKKDLREWTKQDEEAAEHATVDRRVELYDYCFIICVVVNA